MSLKQMLLTRFITPKVQINRASLRTLWYEDENGNILPSDHNGLREVYPAGTKVYQRSRLPRLIIEKTIRLNDDGSGTVVFEGSNTYSSELVLALIKGGNTFDEAVLIAAYSCERCMNALAWQHGLSWGYPIYSDDWYKANTRCKHCGG